MFGELEPMFNYFWENINITDLLLTGIYSISVGGIIYFISTNPKDRNTEIIALSADVYQLSRSIILNSRNIVRLENDTELKIDMRRAEDENINQELDEIYEKLNEINKRIDYIESNMICSYSDEH